LLTPEAVCRRIVTFFLPVQRGLQRTMTGLKDVPKVKPNGCWHKRINYDTCSDDLDESDYQAQQVEVLNELHRVLKEDGTVWMNHKARRAGFKEHMPTDFILKSKLNLYGHVVWNLKRSVNQHVGFLTPVHEYLYQLTKTASPPAFFKKRLAMEFRSSVWAIKPERVKGHPCVSNRIRNTQPYRREFLLRQNGYGRTSRLRRHAHAVLTSPFLPWRINSPFPSNWLRTASSRPPPTATLSFWTAMQVRARLRDKGQC
jgi:hypothetical protein